MLILSVLQNQEGLDIRKRSICFTLFFFWPAIFFENCHLYSCTFMYFEFFGQYNVAFSYKVVWRPHVFSSSKRLKLVTSIKKIVRLVLQLKERGKKGLCHSIYSVFAPTPVWNFSSHLQKKPTTAKHLIFGLEYAAFFSDNRQKIALTKNCIRKSCG